MLAFIAFIAMCPFIVAPWMLGDWFREAKVLWFYAFSGVFMGDYFSKKVHPIFGFFVFLSTLSVAINFFTWNQFADLACIVMAGFMAMRWISLTDGGKNMCLRLLAYGALVSSIYGLFQLLGLDPFFAEDMDAYGRVHPIGFIGQQTLLGSFVVPASAWFLFKKRWVYFVACNVVLLFCDSTMSWISLGAVLAVWFGHEFGRGSAVIAGCVSFCVLMVAGIIFKDAHIFSASGRMPVWSEAARYIEMMPWSGYGLGNYKNMYMVFHTPDGPPFMNLHNDYLQVLFELGWLGLCVVLLGVVRALGNLWRGLSDPSMALYGAIFLALAVNSLGSFPIRLLPHSLMALFAWVELVRQRPTSLYASLG